MLKHSITLLELQEEEPGVYRWHPCSLAWATATRQKGSNLFSKAGMGAVSMLFEMHPRALTLHHAIQWHGQHYFITSIDRKSPVLMHVETALVDIAWCTSSRVPDGPDENKRPREDLAQLADFPAVLTEKYQGFESALPTGQVTQTFVLVTPKAISLRVGDVVETNGGMYSVQICHTLDQYKNEYEIYRKGDV